MAKSDSFFIRGKTNAGSASYAETEIDIGHVVDALGKTVMRIGLFQQTRLPTFDTNSQLNPTLALLMLRTAQ